MTSASRPEPPPSGPRDDRMQIAGRYEVCHLLGEGTLGRLFEAIDRQTTTVVALHVLAPERLTGGAQRQLEAVARWRALSHPSLLRVLDVGEAPIAGEPRPYVVLQYLRGTTLDRLQAAGPLSPRWAIGAARMLADALSLAHEHDLVHGDVRPQSVIAVGPRPVLMSAQLAAMIATGARARATTQDLGAEGFAAPEDDVDERSDVYGVGALLRWLLLAGGGGSWRAPELDAELEAICERATSPEPALRQPSIGELRAELDDYLARHDRAAVRRLILAGGGAEQVSAPLDGATTIVGADPRCPLRLPPGTPSVLFRLLRPRSDTIALAADGVELRSGHEPLGRRPLRHGDAIDAGGLRFVFRRDEE